MKSIFKFIGQLFKGIWIVLNFIRRFVMSLIILILVLTLGIGMLVHQEKPLPQVNHPGALTLDLEGSLVEKRQSNSNLNQITQQVMGRPIQQEIDLHELVNSIHQAKDDAQITGLILKVGDLSPSGLTKLHTVGEALKEFRQSGKPVVAIADNYSQGQYYLASFADQIILNPAGSVMIKGLSAHTLFYKDAMDKFGIKAHVFRVGIYKSFVEPYQRNEMSKPAKQDLTRWVNQIWQDYTTDVAKNRKIKPSDVAPDAKELLQRLKAVDGNPAQYALTNHLVDHLFTRQQTLGYLKGLFGTTHSDSYHQIALNDYQQLHDGYYQHHSHLPQIAVITATGPIVDGDTTNPHFIASEDMLRKLDKVLKNDQIKGLVLRVDSPGGSAFAAELIRSKLAEIQQTGKPVVVSMGSTAASGGYWISATSDRIFAQPTTITGSIGIFGLFATVEDGLNKLGVHVDGVSTTNYATISPLSPLSDDLAQILQLNVENGYHQFISLVQKGRHYPSYDTVDKLAQGRIWTGREAKANGLVDQLGGLDAAIAYTARLLNLKQYDKIAIQSSKSSTEQLIGSLLDSQFTNWLDSKLPAFLQPAQLQGDLLPTQMWQNDPLKRFSYCTLCQSPL